MTMHNPPHPGEFISDIYLEPNGISGRELADKLDVAASTLSRILKGSSRVTPEMALRLSWGAIHGWLAGEAETPVAALSRVWEEHQLAAGILLFG